MFIIKEGNIGDKPVYLINPHDIKCKYTKDTMMLRSVMIDELGNVCSKAYCKFYNMGEQPDLYPHPDKFKDWVLTNKEDGSLMICDIINGVFNVRTRGTINYLSLDNYKDFDFVISKYPIIDVTTKYSDYTILFEIYSPNNIIVLKPYSEPEIVFLGAYDKRDNTYHSFYSPLGKEIQSIVNCKVPEIYTMNGSVLDIATAIQQWERKEGVVLNYNGDKNRVKMKSNWYLFRHALKSKLNSIDNLIDMYIELGRPDYNTFFNNIETTIDFETANEFRGNISKVYDANKEAQLIIQGMKDFIDYKVIYLKTRKEQALLIMSAYGDTNRSGMLFKILDGNTLDNKDIKKLIFQCLK